MHTTIQISGNIIRNRKSAYAVDIWKKLSDRIIDLFIRSNVRIICIPFTLLTSLPPPHMAVHTRETERKPEWPCYIVCILPTVQKTIQGSSHKCWLTPTSSVFQITSIGKPNAEETVTAATRRGLQWNEGSETELVLLPSYCATAHWQIFFFPSHSPLTDVFFDFDQMLQALWISKRDENPKQT